MMQGGARLDYRPDIDGLRAVAVLLVLLHHVWPGAVRGGYVGVDVFFVISGYLITRIVAGQVSAGTFRFREFYARRVIRLLPALAAMLASVLFAGWFLLLPSDYVALLRAALATTLLSSNFAFWKILALGYFAPDATLNPLLHTWSLGVEEQFYLVFPLALLICIRLWPGRLTMLALAAMFVSLGASIALTAGHSVAVFYMTPFRAWEFLVGALLAIGMLPVIGKPALRTAFVAMGLLAIAGAAYFYSPATPFPGSAALLPVLGAAAIIHGGTNPSGHPPRTVLTTNTVVYVGRTSYSLYLWHWPLVTLFRYVSATEVGFWQGCLLLVVSMAIGALSYEFIEVPFRSRNRFSRATVVRGSLAASAAVACISLAGVVSGGLGSPADERARAFDEERATNIPYSRCDKLLDWCVIGDARSKPSLVFWGDSHMISWGPAVDRELRAAGRSGYFVVHSACPPVFGLASTDTPDCLEANARLKRYLSTRPGIEGVVMAAHWNMYLKRDRIRIDPSHPDTVEARVVLANAIDATASSLASEGIRAVILGSVPTYAHNVPFELARSNKNMRLAAPLVPASHTFGPVLHCVADRHGGAYVDVSAAMCPQGRCQTQRDGRSNYHDDGHLSESGALAYSYLMGEAIKGATDVSSPLR